MSSAPAPFRLRLTAAQTGVDPRTHYWFKAGPDDYRRLCDNTPWVRRRRSSVHPYGLCWRCHGMRQDDRERGLRAFSLTHRQTGVFARNPVDTCELDEDMTRPLSMQTFGKFYAKDKAGREKHFADRAKQRQRRLRHQQQGRQTGGGDPYKVLLKHIEEHHWNTNDIEQLAANARYPNPKMSGYRTWESYYLDIQQKYVAKWREQQGSYRPALPVDVEVGRLLVRVDPEVGLRPWVPNSPPQWVLKLWLANAPPSDNVLDAYLYLLGEGASIGDWTRFAQLGVWDVRWRPDFWSFEPRHNVAVWMREAAEEYLDLEQRYRP